MYNEIRWLKATTKEQDNEIKRLHVTLARKDADSARLGKLERMVAARAGCIGLGSRNLFYISKIDGDHWHCIATAKNLRATIDAVEEGKP